MGWTGELKLNRVFLMLKKLRGYHLLFGNLKKNNLDFFVDKKWLYWYFLEKNSEFWYNQTQMSNFTQFGFFLGIFFSFKVTKVSTEH
jgi:hypothetical protein